MSCKYCSSSGRYISYGGYTYGGTGDLSGIVANIIDCKACNGTGHFDEEELVTVPKKHVKEEYWEN